MEVLTCLIDEGSARSGMLRATCAANAGNRPCPEGQVVQ